MNHTNHPFMKTSPERLTKGLASGSPSKTFTTALFLAIPALAFGSLFSGCATTLLPAPAQANTPRQEALVCPECKMVAVTTYQPLSSGFGGPGWRSYGWGGPANPLHVYQHQCPGCQGAIVTLFKEGKLQHKCSICKEKPFNCPVVHPAA